MAVPGRCRPHAWQLAVAYEVCVCVCVCVRARVRACVLVDFQIIVLIYK